MPMLGQTPALSLLQKRARRQGAEAREDGGIPRSGGFGTEGGPGPTGVPTTTAGAGARAPARPDPVVLEKASRRRFGAEYRARILREADQLTEPGQVGAFLRREGLYSSHLSVLRKQPDAGSLEALAPKRRGRKPDPKSPPVEENKRLQRENAKLLRKLRWTEAILDVQKNSPRSWGSNCRHMTP